MVEYQEPEYLPWDGRRVPMTFLAGYLGAGKTTLLNELLAISDRPLAVLVNDIGEINIDAALIRARHGDTIELTDGCVCCSLSEGFAVAIDRLRAREQPPDHAVVELSGVADPNRVLPWASSAGFKLDGVLCAVDVTELADRLADPLAARLLTTQIEAADLVVLTKLDLVDPDATAETRSRVSAIAPSTPVVASGPTVAASLLELGGRRPEGTAEIPQPTLFDRHVTSALELPEPVGRPELERLLDELPTDTVRAKGIARADDGARLLIQVVGRRRSITDLPTAEDERTTPLVVIRLPELQ
ncbi:MAG: GTP-binding protein [Acidimicrobiia bacterium]|nr:GTP-binding protein [Acidimicrobiia bacterium]